MRVQKVDRARVQTTTVVLVLAAVLSAGCSSPLTPPDPVPDSAGDEPIGGTEEEVPSADGSVPAQEATFSPVAGALGWRSFQFGTGADDAGRAVAVGPGAVTAVAGRSGGSAFLTKFAAGGARLWERTISGVEPNGVGFDSAGSIYVGGRKSGAASTGWVSRYSPTGTLRWSRSVTSLGSSMPISFAVSGVSNCYLAGSDGEDGVLIKYGADGTRKWSRRFAGRSGGNSTGPSEDYAISVSVDSAGYVYVSGLTDGLLFPAAPVRDEGPGVKHYEHDLWVAKFDTHGNRLWAWQTDFRPTGSSTPTYESAPVVSGINGAAYVTCTSSFSDTIEFRLAVACYSSSGRKWVRVFDRSNPDFIASSVEPHTAAATSDDALSVCGYQSQGGPFLGGQEGRFFIKVGSGGLKWTRDPGALQIGHFIAYPVGGYLLTGTVSGSVLGPSAGGSDAFLARSDRYGVIYR